MRRFLLVRTDLFLANQDDEDLNLWFLGGDAAGWFYGRLLPRKGIGTSLDPTMEDWGWIFAVRVGEIRVTVCVWRFFPLENVWLFGLFAKQRWLRKWSQKELDRAHEVVCDALEAIVTSDPRFEKWAWSESNPWDWNEPIEL